MKFITLLYIFCLFYVFIPGNIINLPIKTTKLNIIMVHGLLFSTILYYTLFIVEDIPNIEGYTKCTPPCSWDDEHDQCENKAGVKCN